MRFDRWRVHRMVTNDQSWMMVLLDREVEMNHNPVGSVELDGQSDLITQQKVVDWHVDLKALFKEASRERSDTHVLRLRSRTTAQHIQMPINNRVGTR